mgnify:CR=1 FL=1
MANIRSPDRFVRMVLGIGLLQLAYFWLGSPWNWVAAAVGVILLVTAALRFCPLYRVIGVKACPAGTSRPWQRAVVALLLLGLAAGGSYASMFFSRKFFLEDFNAMNHFYKQTLFLTGKAQRDEAVANLDQLKPAFAAFVAKYSGYRPHDLKGDGKLVSDFETVNGILAAVEPLVRSGDLHQAHLDLEKVRPVFQDMFKRNGFSMLAVALVDFHDAMETILAAANAKDAAKLASLYPGVSDKLKVVEAEANDPEILAIRQALEDVHAAAQSGASETLPAKGETLKSSFVKVYLKRG